MLDVARKVVEGGWHGRRVVHDEQVGIVEPHDATAVADLGKLGIGEVPLVPADGPRVGVTRYERTLGQAGNLVEADIVEMRDIEDDALLLHAAQDLTTSCGEPALRSIVAARERTRGIPAEGRHEQAPLGAGVHEFDIVREQPSVLDGAHRRDTTFRKRWSNAGRRAHVREAIAVPHQLAVEAAGYVLPERRGAGRFKGIGNEAGKALRPRRGADLFRGELKTAGKQVRGGRWLGQLGCRGRLALPQHAGCGCELCGQALEREHGRGIAMQVEYGKAHDASLKTKFGSRTGTSVPVLGGCDGDGRTRWQSQGAASGLSAAPRLGAMPELARVPASHGSNARRPPSCPPRRPLGTTGTATCRRTGRTRRTAATWRATRYRRTPSACP